MANKGYDPKLKAKYDKMAKQCTEEVMRDLLGAKKITDNEAEDNGDFRQGFWDQKYILKSGKKVVIETEMKDEKWWGPGYGLTGPGPFRYDTVDIPYRKEKNEAGVHMLFSTDKDYGFIVSRKDMDESVAKSGIKRKVTIYEPNGGDYFSVPVEKGFFVEKVNGHWKRWVKTQWVTYPK